jgi:cell division protein FtsA
MFKTKTPNRVTTGQYAVLDVGTSKIVCFIADIDSTGAITVKGIGHQLSKGVRSSAIVDFAEAETSILAAVHAAEQMSGVTIDDVVVSLSGSGLSSRSITVEMALLGEEVSDRDILDIIEQGRASGQDADHEIIHCFPVSYYIDDMKGIVDPRRMFGNTLGAELHVITAPTSMIRNLSHCIARCHLNVADFIAAPYAAALACLEEDEMELGVMLVDIGGGTTSLSIFHHGRNLYTDIIPVGGMHVTNDIAKVISTTVTQAERLKTLHGSCISSSTDDQVLISAPLLGEDEDEDANTLPRSTLVGIIRPRMEEILEMVKRHLENSGFESQAGRRLVLTGGASQLIGVRELAARTFGKQVRLSRPRAIPGMADAATGPAFATAIGMLRAIASPSFEERLYAEATMKGGMFKKVKSLFGLIKEDF